MHTYARALYTHARTFARRFRFLDVYVRVYYTYGPTTAVTLFV